VSADYDEIDVLIDTDPITLGERCRRAERAVRKTERLLQQSSAGEGSNSLTEHERQHRETLRQIRKVVRDAAVPSAAGDDQ
jgi:hypothetical protein